MTPIFIVTISPYIKSHRICSVELKILIDIHYTHPVHLLYLHSRSEYSADSYASNASNPSHHICNDIGTYIYIFMYVQIPFHIRVKAYRYIQAMHGYLHAYKYIPF